MGNLEEIKDMSKPDQLVPDPYTYDNIRENPILQPISETDRSLKDIDEMIAKKTADAIANQAWVNSTLNEVARYSDSRFVKRLFYLVDETADIVKLLTIKNNNLKECIKKVHTLVAEKYGVRVEEEKDDKIPLKKPVIIYGNRDYLNKIVNNKNKKISDFAKEILVLFNSDEETQDENKRFQIACAGYYNKLTEKSDKDIVAKIIRVEV